MRATTETNYIEMYVKICVQLFKKFNSKTDHEMNFKKLLLAKCQKEFYRNQLDDEEDFSRVMLAVFDKEEIDFKKK